MTDQETKKVHDAFCEAVCPRDYDRCRSRVSDAFTCPLFERFKKYLKNKQEAL